MMHLISVVVVDDHALVRKTLRSILEDYPDLTVVGEASNGREAVDVVERFQPTIVIMDIDMPVMNGIEATTKIKAHHPDILVIGLSVTTQRDFQAAMIQAGAAMIIPKEAACEQLHSAIELAVQGK